MKKLAMFLLLAFCFTSVIDAQTDPEVVQSLPAEVHVRLSLPDNKKSFRIGDPIQLTIEFTADQPGYYADPISDHDGQGDKIFIAPDDGVNYWQREMMRGMVYFRDVFGQSELTSTPTRVPLLLNESMRFDKPGHYTVKVSTDRVSKKGGAKIRVTTNEVEFDVREMTEEEEKSEIARLSLLLNAKSNDQTKQLVAQQLSFLTGEPSTREKVRRFLQTEEGYQYISRGFYVARNRDLVLQLLENGLRDTNQPVSRSLLTLVSSIRLLKENGPGPIDRKVIGGLAVMPGVDPQLAEIQSRYLNELVLNLSKRSGKSLTTTATTILTSVPTSDPNRAAMVAEARRAIIPQFNSLPAYDQEYLLRAHWDDLRDASMTNSLKQLLGNNGTGRDVHNAALKRLIEISSDEARPFAVKEICTPLSFIDREIVGSLGMKELPEVDRCLLSQLRQYGQNVARDRIFLEQKAALAVRFATDNIYQDVAEIFREGSATLSLEARATLLAYMAKHNEDEAIPLIVQTLEQIKPEEDFNFLPKLADLYYSKAIGSLLKKRLEGDEPQVASNAAYLIGKHGVADDENVLFARLERWQSDWRDRLSEAEATHQGMIEREIIWALTNAKSWKLSAEKVRDLKLSCLTQMCKQSNRLN